MGLKNDFKYESAVKCTACAAKAGAFIDDRPWAFVVIEIES